MTILIGICSLPEGSDLLSKIMQTISTLLALASLLAYCGQSAIYTVEHFRSDDIENGLFALIQVLAVFATLASSVSLLSHRRSVRDFFDRIQAIFDECNYLDLRKTWKFIQIS